MYLIKGVSAGIEMGGNEGQRANSEKMQQQQQQQQQQQRAAPAAATSVQAGGTLRRQLVGPLT
jgi:hypothetical protein